MSKARVFEWNGASKTIKEWSQDPRCVCEYYALKQRLNSGWEIEKAITSPVYGKDAKQMQVGEKINHLTLLEIFEKEEKSQNVKYGKFRCDGYHDEPRIVYYRYRSVVSEETKSCGCHRSNRMSKLYENHTPTYSVDLNDRLLHLWWEIKRKCYEKDNIKYSLFGARGIQICEEWCRSFDNFYEWCYQNGYKNGKILRRHNTSDHFSPDNCYWIKKNFTKERLYKTWFSMHKRCYNIKCKGYCTWGARGIRVCKEWKSYYKFRKWSLENGYNDKLTIDRIDNNWHYEPNNCRWATRDQQLESIYNNRQILAFGEIKSILHWTRDVRCKVDIETLKRNLLQGIDPEIAMI